MVGGLDQTERADLYKVIELSTSTRVAPRYRAGK